MKEKLLLFPYNGNAAEALDCIYDAFEVIGFIDDNIDKQGINDLGFTVFSREVISKYPEAKMLAVPGSPETYLSRSKAINSLKIAAERFATLIHPQAAVSARARIGHNCLIMAGVSISAGAVIGNHVVILPNSVVHHDACVEDYTLIGSNVAVAGYVRIGVNCYIGSGSNIIDHVIVGDFALVGLGSNVICDVPEHVRVAGNPARNI
jgi:sugar O-acyltransferase (sialic acid O-acetyltransferase NeuD family)